MKADACPSTLLLRSRRVVLPHAEALALDAHLGDCEDCRVLALALSDFEAVATSDRRDAQRLERLAALARDHVGGSERSSGVERRWRGRLPVGQRLARALLAAGALSLLALGASAALLVAGPELGPAPAPWLSLPGGRGHGAGDAVIQAARRAERAARELVISNPLQTAGEDANDGRARAERSAAARLDAGGLFKDANEARRAGDTALATQLYRELQRSHPASAEAQLSHVSFGHLLLSVGQGRAALSQFDAALRASAAKSVKAEALYGRALSLGRVGQRASERAAWQRLLREFPESPYAAQARRRLGEP